VLLRRTVGHTHGEITYLQAQLSQKQSDHTQQVTQESQGRYWRREMMLWQQLRLSLVEAGKSTGQIEQDGLELLGALCLQLQQPG